MDCMTLWPFLIVKRGREQYITDRVLRHEAIHARQQKELLVVGFLIVYIVLWIAGLVKYRDLELAYKGHPMELEAYTNEGDTTYLTRRKWCAWRYFI
jgi:heme A synthase